MNERHMAEIDWHIECEHDWVTESESVIRCSICGIVSVTGDQEYKHEPAFD